MKEYIFGKDGAKLGRKLKKLVVFILTFGILLSGIGAMKVSAASYTLSGFSMLEVEKIPVDTDLIEDVDIDEVAELQSLESNWNESFDEADLRYMSAIVYAEANGMGYTAKLAVANVVLNRMYNTKSWGHVNTVHDVIYDKKGGVQFSPVKDGNMKKALAIYDSMDPAKCKKWQIEAMEACIEVAKAAFRGEKAVPDNFMYFNAYITSTTKKCLEKGRSFVILEKHIYYTTEVSKE